jgi:hypothetical protein
VAAPSGSVGPQLAQPIGLSGQSEPALTEVRGRSTSLSGMESPFDRDDSCYAHSESCLAGSRETDHVWALVVIGITAGVATATTITRLAGTRITVQRSAILHQGNTPSTAGDYD